MSRNVTALGLKQRPLSELLTAFDTKLKGLWIPSGIKASDSTHWEDATANNLDLTLYNTPTDTTVSGQAGLLFNGTNQYMDSGAATFASFVATNALTFMMVLTREGAGGANDTGSGTCYNNKSAAGDSGGYVNLVPFYTNGGTNKIQCELLSATTAFDTGDTAPALSAPVLVEIWYSASAINFRVNANTAVTGATGPATLGARTGILRLGVGFAAYLNCKISMALICNAARTGTESTNARAIIASAYSQPTWAT